MQSTDNTNRSLLLNPFPRMKLNFRQNKKCSKSRRKLNLPPPLICFPNFKPQSLAMAPSCLFPQLILLTHHLCWNNKVKEVYCVIHLIKIACQEQLMYFEKCLIKLHDQYQNDPLTKRNSMEWRHPTEPMPLKDKAQQLKIDEYSRVPTNKIHSFGEF